MANACENHHGAAPSGRLLVLCDRLTLAGLCSLSTCSATPRTVLAVVGVTRTAPADRAAVAMMTERRAWGDGRRETQSRGASALLRRYGVFGCAPLRSAAKGGPVFRFSGLGLWAVVASHGSHGAKLESTLSFGTSGLEPVGESAGGGGPKPGEGSSDPLTPRRQMMRLTCCAACIDVCASYMSRERAGKRATYTHCCGS